MNSREVLFNTIFDCQDKIAKLRKTPLNHNGKILMKKYMKTMKLLKLDLKKLDDPFYGIEN